MSLGVSLAVHGVAVASLVLALYSPWSETQPEKASILTVAARMETVDLAILQEPEPETLAELDMPDAELEPIPLEDFTDAITEPTADPFAEDAKPMAVEAPLRPSELNPHNLLRDPELPRKAKAVRPAASQPAPAAASAPEPEGPTVEQETDAPAADALVPPSLIPSECPPPAYPRMAERRGWTGTVVLLIDVAADGSVTAVRIESSSGHSILDDAAVAAVRTWRFRPGTLGGQKSALVVRRPISFEN